MSEKETIFPPKAFMRAIPGEHVAEFAKRVRDRATSVSGVVYGEHNDRVVCAIPGMSARDIQDQWYALGETP